MQHIFYINQCVPTHKDAYILVEAGNLCKKYK